MKFTTSIITLLIAFIGLSFTSCAEKMSIEKATSLIAAHPYLPEYHIGVTNKKQEGCESDYVGSKDGAYVMIRGANVTAYYYKMNTLKIDKVEDLVIEDKTAHCRVILVPDNVSKASEGVKDVRPKKGGEAFNVKFINAEGEGWKISEFEPVNRLFFKNIWRDGNLVYRVTPSFFSE